MGKLSETKLKTLLQGGETNNVSRFQATQRVAQLKVKEAYR